MNITTIFLGRTGAGALYSLEMVNALSRHHNIQVILSESIENKESWVNNFLGNENVSLNFFPTYTDTRSFLLASFNFYNFYKIIKTIKKYAPDAIYVPFIPLWAPILYLFLRKYKIFSTVHDVTLHSGENKVLYFLYTAAIKLSDKLIILNQKDIGNAMNLGFEKDDVCVIPHASFSFYNKRVQAAKVELTYTMLFIGRIEKYKGIHLLLDAYHYAKKEIPHLKLIIAGRGDINPYMDQVHQTTSITLVNKWLTDIEISDLVDKCDFIVLPYLDASQSGVIPLAFGCGRTVIVTNVGALSEQVPEHTGLVVEPGFMEIANAMIHLYRNPTLIQEYGNNASIYAKEELSWEKSADVLVSFIQRHIGN